MNPRKCEKYTTGNLEPPNIHSTCKKNNDRETTIYLLSFLHWKLRLHSDGLYFEPEDSDPYI